MKAVISGIAALGLLGWYVSGGGEGPDASREIARPPARVFSEVSALMPPVSSSSSGLGADGRQHSLALDLRKSHDRSIDYRIMLDGEEVLAMHLSFESIDQGRGTRLSGDLEVDQALVDFAAAQGGTEPKPMPAFAVDWAMDQMVDTIADALENGRPLSREMLFPLLRTRS